MLGWRKCWMVASYIVTLCMSTSSLSTYNSLIDWFCCSWHALLFEFTSTYKVVVVNAIYFFLHCFVIFFFCIFSSVFSFLWVIYSVVLNNVRPHFVLICSLIIIIWWLFFCCVAEILCLVQDCFSIHHRK